MLMTDSKNIIFCNDFCVYSQSTLYSCEKMNVELVISD